MDSRRASAHERELVIGLNVAALPAARMLVIHALRWDASRQQRSQTVSREAQSDGLVVAANHGGDLAV
jgi:hypothetical protein